MKRRTTPGTARLGRVALLVVCLATSMGVGLFAYRARGKPDPYEDMAIVPVRRVALNASVVAAGEVDSSVKTLIECELEDVAFRNGGTSISASGSSIIIELVPEGTMVKEGQVLCRLNSAEYEEMVRQQQIELEEDRAQYEASKLNLETLEIQLREYRDGQFVALQEQMQGDIALATADLESQKDRVAWAEHMAELGYLASSRLATERNQLLRCELALQEAKIALDNLVKYKAPKTILAMESQIAGARVELSFQEIRVRRDEEQLAEYQEQVEHCTIRAPHDGFLIYATDDDDAPIELGASVRQNQDLFFLPDLTQMEVVTNLHETVVRRVQAGMPARVRIEAFPNALLEGEVVAVAPLPLSIRSRYRNDEVKNYQARVKLHVVPSGLMPGMMAQVEILTAHRPEVLAIPTETMVIEDGLRYCYVAGPEGIERRPITIGEYHTRLLEVVDGLSEGEQVVLAPELLASHP